MADIEKAKKIILNIPGDCGKNIMATALVAALRKQNSKAKIVIISPWINSVWKNNPNVNAIYDLSKDEYLYKKEILGEDVLFLSGEPYLETDFIHKQRHLKNIWADLLSIKYNGESTELFFSEEESQRVKDKLPKDKPLMMLQTHDGSKNQEYPISWMRDMPLPLAQKIVNAMVKKGYRVIHLRREDQYALANTEYIDMNTRELLCCTQFADKALYIDSFAQHAAAAFNKPAVVIWIGNKPDIFGYDLHKNIKPKEQLQFRHRMDSYLDIWNLTGKIHEYPYETDDIFDFDEIMKALED